jgi:hypothetical protein
MPASAALLLLSASRPTATRALPRSRPPTHQSCPLAEMKFGPTPTPEATAQKEAVATPVEKVENPALSI